MALRCVALRYIALQYSSYDVYYIALQYICQYIFVKKFNYLFLHYLTVYFSTEQIAEKENSNQQGKYSNSFNGDKGTEKQKQVKAKKYNF